MGVSVEASCSDELRALVLPPVKLESDRTLKVFHCLVVDDYYCLIAAFPNLELSFAGSICAVYRTADAQYHSTWQFEEATGQVVTERDRSSFTQ